MCAIIILHSPPFLPPPHLHSHHPDPHATALSTPKYEMPSDNTKELDPPHMLADHPDVPRLSIGMVEWVLPSRG